MANSACETELHVVRLDLVVEISERVMEALALARVERPVEHISDQSRSRALSLVISLRQKCWASAPPPANSTLSPRAPRQRPRP